MEPCISCRERGRVRTCGQKQQKMPRKEKPLPNDLRILLGRQTETEREDNATMLEFTVLVIFYL